MEVISNEEKDSDQNFLGTTYIKFATLKNGFLKPWLKNKYQLKTDVHSKFTKFEIFSLIFIFLMLIRTIKVLTLEVDIGQDDTLLMYFGSPWHHLSGNFSHMETMFFLWSLNFVALYLYVIHSPDEHYKWLEIYAFLAGIIPHQSIGN
jgi:hypothetical protein